MSLSRAGIAITIILLASTLIAHANSASADKQSPARTSPFNEKWLDTVVSIEQLQPDHSLDGAIVRNQDGTIKLIPKPIGTGFIVKTRSNHLVLITAKHVVVDLTLDEVGNSKVNTKNRLRYRLNQVEGPAYLIKDEELISKELGPWFMATKNDVAVRFLEWKETARFSVISQADFIPKADLQVGANLLVLGFPLGLRSPEHPNPIARRGMVARSDRDRLIADALIFPGNSGGPVVYTPPLKVGSGMTSPFVNEERLAGLAISYETHKEIAESTQTKKPRVLFEENSGLASIEPADAILELLEHPDVQSFEANIINK